MSQAKVSTDRVTFSADVDFLVIRENSEGEYVDAGGRFKIGTADEVGQKAKVKSSYLSRHFTTGNVTGAWGYKPTKTGQ